jgi:hypothetical protein
MHAGRHRGARASSAGRSSTWLRTGRHLAGALRRRGIDDRIQAFFGAENLRAQALMTGALAALIFSGLLIIVPIDRP